MQVKELFDSIAPQNAENSTVANSLPLFLKYSVKCLFFKRLYQTIENLKYQFMEKQKRVIDPKSYMHTFRLNEQQQVQFEKMMLTAGQRSQSKFILSRIFG